MKNRIIRILMKGQAKDEFEKLNRIVGEQQAKGIANSSEMQLLKSIRQKIELLKINPTFGDNIPKKLIPRTMDVTNLFRIELTGYWRMIYTMDGNEIEVIAFILYIIGHDEYDKIFGYKKK